MKSRSAIFLIASILLCAHAFATNHKSSPKTPPAPVQPAPTARADAMAGAQATGTATATQQQEAHADASNKGNAQQVLITNPRELAIAPAAIAPNIYPSAVCYTGSSAGVSFGNSGFGAGLSGGKAKLDPECELRELARSFAAIGNLQAANLVLCATEGAKRVFGEGCPAMGGLRADAAYSLEDVAKAVMDMPVPWVTRDELTVREKKLLEAATSK